MEITEEVNPLWLRAWHWLQAFCLLGLMVTGIVMHYADAGWNLLPFRAAVLTHDVLGIAALALWVGFATMNLLSGNISHYIPRGHGIRDLYRQVRHYAWGMFRGESAPFPLTFREKFNPVQKMTYVIVMYVLLPVSALSGGLLMAPELAPSTALGGGGLWPMAMLHLTVGWLLALFLIFHIYLATTGEHISTLYEEMITGMRTSDMPPPLEPAASQPEPAGSQSEPPASQ